MKPYQKALIATAFTMYFLYHMVTDTARGQGLMPMSVESAWLTNMTYLLPLMLSLIWLLKSVREMVLDGKDK